MSPLNDVETIKEVMDEVMREKNALVGRLNAMHQLIAEEEDPVAKVRRKVEWASTRDRSVDALKKIVASLQRALEEDESSTHGSDTASPRSSASSASSPSFTNESLDHNNQAVFERTATCDPDSRYEAPQEAGAAAHRLPTRLDKDAGGQGGEVFRPRAQSLGCVVQGSGLASWPASKAAGFLKRVSSEASLLPHQFRKSVQKSARRFSSSMLRRVGWSPALQDSQWVWEQRVINGYSV